MEDLEKMVEELLRSNVLWEKKWAACGDSFTEGDFKGSEEAFLFAEGLYEGQKKVYPFFIGRRNHMTVINEAKCGSTMTDLSTRKDAFSIERYKRIPNDVDYITLCFGINDDDAHQKSPLGDINDTGNTTFFGAWNTVLEYLLTRFPYAKIGVIVPNGCTKTYTDAIRAVSRKWGIPYLDIPGDYAVPLMNRVSEKGEVCDLARKLRYDNFSVSDKNRHPNARAHEFESTFIEHWLRSL